jgi:hypothetical protein
MFSINLIIFTVLKEADGIPANRFVFVTITNTAVYRYPDEAVAKGATRPIILIFGSFVFRRCKTINNIWD